MGKFPGKKRSLVNHSSTTAALPMLSIASMGQVPEAGPGPAESKVCGTRQAGGPGSSSWACSARSVCSGSRRAVPIDAVQKSGRLCPAVKLRRNNSAAGTYGSPVVINAGVLCGGRHRRLPAARRAKLVFPASVQMTAASQRRGGTAFWPVPGYTSGSIRTHVEDVRFRLRHLTRSCR